ncbi:NADH:flavin oxidoreductase/NADH oxidase [Streptomyces lincolnensis]|uniref:NADH:flavin oxidoreductase/NADH oxidase n=1 Tax=Streptomyces lincolnensis TaxID=1915 RepID=A0A1B1M0Y3_STRLN|nr:hypothetical protein [Streptomyces lincolnensis]ANS62231.1 NADH:flavin oxidoreductase/NADH oxidase [Streptomyces lincolnensis]ANS70807.1 NADH:flavin oxidoreductase/NADH oxidase [Streptomyces lincolnensis]AXG51162.1 NADH:flavin oxidoreductase/NADH oxidase [Streptomyces lincolnensis]
MWPNTLILNRAGTDIATRAKDIDNGIADVITVGSMALANPDLVERLHPSTAAARPATPTTPPTHTA